MKQKKGIKLGKLVGVYTIILIVIFMCLLYAEKNGAIFCSTIAYDVK